MVRSRKLSTGIVLTGLLVLTDPVQSARLDFRLVPNLSLSNEWTQHGRDAARTSFQPDSVTPPWKWEWSWNGSDASGKVISGKIRLPRCAQPITGGGSVFVACGNDGVAAIDAATGNELWRRTPGGAIRSTVAFDAASHSLFVVSANGHLYKMNPATGATTGDFNGNATSDLPLPPCVAGGRVFFSIGTKLFAVDPSDMAQIWSYDAGSVIQTPPTYSGSRDRLVVCTADLYVHAVSNAAGLRAWRTKPSVHTPGEPFEYSYGWPVIAERHGLALVRMRSDWGLMWQTGQEFDTSNTKIRAMLVANPAQQCHFALDLDDGTVPFVCNNGQGGYGDGGYMPIGSMPVVKVFSSGDEVVYNVIRGEHRWDTRWDSHFGEMVLDSITVPGLKAGYVRWIRHGNRSSDDAYLLTDEQPFVTMAGNQLFGLHWLIGYALSITDRGPGRGTFGNKIESVNLPHVICSQGSCGGCAFSPLHYCAERLSEDPSCGRIYPGGFYVCYGAGTVHDNYWGAYGAWVVSAGLVLCRTNDGAVVCLGSGNPLAKQGASPVPITQTSGYPATRPAGNVPDISADQAHLLAGRTTAVTGTIKYVFNNGKTVLLGFAYPHQGVFKIQIPSENWPAFKGMGTEMGRNRAQIFREGDRVRVVGTIRWYQGDPAIFVTDPSVISLSGKGGN